MNIMKQQNLLILLFLIFTISSCKNEEKKETFETEESTEEVFIDYNENFQSIYTVKDIGDLDLKMSDKEIESFGKKLATLDSIGSNLKNDNLKGLIKNECWNNRPKTIRDLTDGVLIDAYSFEKGDEKKLGILGFFNVELTDKQKVIVVEYSQEGTQYCDNKPNKYGIGARLMMKVTKSKRNAKLNTPQQITASVIFGRAEVTYSLRTFGITGSGIGKLNKTGSLSEDTYQEFIQEISNLIVEMYKKESSFIVVPQPLPLKNINNN
jgi:hypothetical protein